MDAVSQGERQIVWLLLVASRAGRRGGYRVWLLSKATFSSSARMRADLGQRVEQGELADVGRADNADRQAHRGSALRSTRTRTHHPGLVSCSVVASAVLSSLQARS